MVPVVHFRAMETHGGDLQLVSHRNDRARCRRLWEYGNVNVSNAVP